MFKLTIKTPEQRHYFHTFFSVFIVDFQRVNVCLEVKHDSNFPLLSLSYNYHLTNKYFLHLATRIIKEEYLFFGPNSLSNIIIKKLTRGMTMSANAFVYLYSSGK